ncbi:MAG: 4-(cytidine 5'-diphospho)-2-C-methyl-D-erythritol kinase [Fibrobacter sp.]|nr:4-(cytidine 5'-diphospho)-2-C-methyl-D-erythritol kinase [Fibrobacter sp.]
MEKKSYTRVTLSLDVVNRIEDGPHKGYHELAIIKHQIEMHDIISLKNSSSTSIDCDDPRVPCDQSNICWRAVDLIKNEYDIDKHVSITIQKKIPVMGGMAGGSANAETTLSLLNDLWGLGLSSELLMASGRKLGMDVPYFFAGGTAFDSEATGCLRKIPSELRLYFVIAIPDFGVSTSEAYRGLDYSHINKQHEKTLMMESCFGKNDLNGVISSMHNDFEENVFRAHPALVKVKADLMEAGCLMAVMTGSGSTVIGVTSDISSAEKICGKMNLRTVISSTLNS